MLLLFETGLREKQRGLAKTIEKGQKEIRALADLGPGNVIDDFSGSASKENMPRDRRNRTLLQKLVLTLKPISNGDFGICATGEDAIAFKRLHALPWATNCIECKQHRDQAVN